MAGEKENAQEQKIWSDDDTKLLHRLEDVFGIQIALRIRAFKDGQLRLGMPLKLSSKTDLGGRPWDLQLSEAYANIFHKFESILYTEH